MTSQPILRRISMKQYLDEIKKVCIDKLYKLVVIDDKLDCLNSLCKVLEIITLLGD